MPGKKHWRLSTPFRRSSGKQDSSLNQRAAEGRISSVYLSDDSSTNGFIIIPEFDDSVRDTPHEEFIHASYLSNLPAVTSSNSSSPGGVDSYPYDLEVIGLEHTSCFGGGPHHASVVNTGQDDDLTRRLGSAYEHIRSMTSAVSPRVLLSSDPRALRKQLGVPQHSVLNYAIHSSPDLPNPHTSPPEPTSLPPINSPVGSHTIISEELELDLNAHGHPPPRCRCSQDPFQPVEMRPMAIAPTAPEDLPSKCGIIRKPWSARIVCASKPIPNPLELSKRRTPKSVVSLFSLPSTRPQAFRSFTRKSVVDTPPLKNMPRWQISLPQTRPNSPFRVNIPLHHTWHDRRTDFNSPFKCHFKTVQPHETSPQRFSGSTDALASLAWIGTSPTTSKVCTANRGQASSAFLPDHLNMAIAIEDDSISDDFLVDQLEKVRRIPGPFEWVRDASSLKASGNAHLHNVTEDDNGHYHASCLLTSPSAPDRFSKPCDVPLPSPPISNDTTSGLDDAAVWQAARKALLCIREIIRTEKKYQEALRMLLNAQTATPPPPSMVPHVSALVRVSEILLRSFLEDPSAWGVSTAFITSEDELEASMVPWCAVAGGFFTDENDPQSSGSTGKRLLRRSGVMPSSPSATKRISVPFGPQLPPMFSMVNSANKVQERTNDDYRTDQNVLTEQERKTAFAPLQNPKSADGRSLSGQPPSRKLSVRDLAIQPIQRVMRYVLLYRDLLDCTPPTSPSHLLVERALEAATRIAGHCDRAQRNPAFCYDS